MKVNGINLLFRDDITSKDTPSLEKYISTLEKDHSNNLQGFGPIWMSYSETIKVLKERAGAV